MAKLLDNEQIRLISAFIDQSLPLDEEETKVFYELLDEMEPEEKEAIMEVITSWKQEGIEEGRQEGIQIGKHDAVLNVAMRQLPAAEREKIEQLSLSQLEDLCEDALSFTSRGDLTKWLAQRA